MLDVILVNQDDEEIGDCDKLKAHLGQGILHRAYTILIFSSKGEVLLQKRSLKKMLWPLYWEASCSSHQFPGEKDMGETFENAGKKLKQEMGFECSLTYVGKFVYHSLYKNIGAENEICWVLKGEWSGRVNPNPEEALDFKWIDLAELKAQIASQPDKFAPWLLPAINLLLP